MPFDIHFAVIERGQKVGDARLDAGECLFGLIGDTGAATAENAVSKGDLLGVHI
ncbi:hypothetical protein D3C73_1327980 [compost metagenome]